MGVRVHMCCGALYSQKSVLSSHVVSDIGQHRWQQAPLPTEPACWPLTCSIYLALIAWILSVYYTQLTKQMPM